MHCLQSRLRWKRRWALRTLTPTNNAITSERITEWLASDDPTMQIEAIRTLQDSQLADRDKLLWKIVADPNSNDQQRAEAVVGIHAESVKMSPS